MSDPVAERLAAIRARAEGVKTWKPWTAPEPTAQIIDADVPDLLDALEAVLKLADRLDKDAARIHRRGVPLNASLDFTVERSDRAADLMHAAEDIRRVVASVLGTDTKETADDDS